MDRVDPPSTVSPASFVSPRFALAMLTMALAVAASLVLGLRPAQVPLEPLGDIVTIASGEEIQVEDYLVPEKYTVVDFYADWCTTCRKVTPVLEGFARRDTRVALRKVNVVSWDSPVARQYGLTALPYLLLFGPQGNLLAQGEGVLEALERLPS
jgi:thiol-disulfide isomerase/thioredoxin